MPRPVNPGTITVGTGLAAQDSIEANALVNPTGGNDGLRVHILDPSRAHMARAIGLEDVGGYYSSDHVEGALQEIGTTLTAPSGLQNGVVAGCGFSAAGLTVTLDTPSTIRIGTDRDLSGQSEALGNNATNWLYVDPAGTLTHSVGASPPSFSSPENILLWRIVTAAGAVTSSTDARFWVPNLDRKVPFTVRASGTATDSVAEACFVTLDAAMLYLNFFGNGTQQKTKLIIRGPHTISSTVTISQNDIEFEGDENAEFITGAALTPMFDLNAKSRITFKNILFTCNNATSVAIQGALGGNSDLRVERCRFVTGTQDWNRAVNLSGAAPTTGVMIRECRIAAADTGIRITRPVQAKVFDCEVTEAGSAGVTGISLGSTAVVLTTEGQSVVRNCVVTGFATGILLNGLNNEASGCVLTGCDTGVSVYQQSQLVRVKDCDVTLDGTTGLSGVLVDSAPGTRISGCTLSLTRAAWVAEVPFGVGVNTSNDVAVVDCIIAGFLNDVGNLGSGVQAAGVCDRLTVRGGAISDCYNGVNVTNAGSDGVVVSGVDIRDVAEGVILSGPTSIVADCQVALDATLGMNGLTLSGRNARATGCTVIASRAVGSYAFGDNPVGIHLSGNDSIAQGCYVSNFRNTTNPLTAAGYWIEGDRCSVSGGTVDLAQFGVLVDGDDSKFDGVNVVTSNTCFRLQGANPLLANCLASIDSTTGTTGISVQSAGTGTMIANCRVECGRTVWAGETPLGVQFNAANAKMVNTRVTGFRNSGDALGYGLGVTAGGSFNVSGCTFDTCYNGVAVTVTAIDNWQIVGNRFASIDIAAVSAAACSNIVISNNTFEAPGTSPAISLGNGTTDAVVSGNYINGNQVTTVGIQLSGADGGATRTRRFTIADNVIEQMTTAGIFLNGYVQNGTVVGNQVDGFLAADAVNPTATGIRLLAVATGALPKYVTVADNTVWRCARGITAVGTNADPVHQLTFEGNNVHHCGVAQTGATITSFTTAGSVGIGIDHGRQVVVSNNTVYKIGVIISNTDVEAFPTTGGVDVNSQGILVHNTLGCSVTGNTVTDSMSTGSGTGNGIFVRQGGAGHGAGNTFSNQGVAVSGNNVLWNSGLAGNGSGTFGVEVVVERGTDPATAAHAMSDVSLVNNVIRLMKTAAIRVLVGTESNLAGLVIEGNAVRESSVDGIRVETNGSSASILNRAAIVGNTINTITAIGIALIPGGVGSFSGVSVDENSVESTGSHGISVIPSVVNCAIGDISVSGNKLANVSVAGSGILFLNSIAAVAFEHFTIRGNHITNAQDTGGDAIRVASTDIPIRDVVISDNVIGNPLNVGSPGRGITVSTTVSGASDVPMRRITIAGNTILTANNTCVRVLSDGLIENLKIVNNVLDTNASPGRPLSILTTRTNSANEYVEGLVISGNTCTGGIGSRLELTNGNKLRGLVVSGNTFSDTTEGASETGDHAGFSVSVKTVNAGGSTPSVSDLAFTGNTFSECDEQGLSLRFGDSADEVTDDIVDVSIVGNAFSRCTTGATFNGSAVIRYAANGPTRNLIIANNTIADSTGEDAISQGAIHVLCSHSTGTDLSIENLQVTGNSLNGCGGCGIKVEDSALGTAWTASNINIVGNTIQDQMNDAVRLALGAFTVARMVSVSGNAIDGVSGPTASDLGINILGPTANTLALVSVQNNRIRNAGSTTGGNGQIVVDAANALSGLNISGNIISAGGFTGGIFVEASGTLQDVNVNDNTVNDTSADGIIVSVTGANDISTLTVSGNTLVSSGDDGIQVLWAGGVLESCSITGNSVLSTGSGQGIQVGALNAGTIRGLTVVGNTLRSTFQDGIAVNLATTGGTLLSITVANNAIHNFNTNNSSTFDGGLRMTGEDATGVVVSGNTFVSAQSEAVGLHFDIEGVIRSFNVCDNVTDLGDAANTTSMVFDTGASADQLGMSFTGNSFRAAVNGVNAAASSFAPQRSVVAHNSERITAGAGTWAAFAAAFTNSIVAPNQV